MVNDADNQTDKQYTVTPTPSPDHFELDSEISSLLPPLSPQQLEGLEQSILREGRALSPLVVWKETNKLLDGHHRWPILQKHPQIQYKIEYVHLASLEEARKWVFAHQDNRRTWRSRFEQIEHYIRAFGETFQQGRQVRMKSGKANPSDNCPEGNTWHDDIAALCTGPGRISGKTVQRVTQALQRYRCACDIVDERQVERIGLANKVLEELRSGVRKPANAKRGFDEARKEVRRHHAHDEAPGLIGTLVANDQTGVLNRIIKVNETPLEVLHLIPDGQVGLYFSSYPYYCEKNYGRGEEADNMPYDEQLAFFKALAVEMIRTLRPGGRCGINFDSVTSRPQNGNNEERFRHYKRPSTADLTNIMREVGFLYMQEHLWYKNNHNYNNCQWGTFASPECPIHIRDWEPVLVFTKPNIESKNPFALTETNETLGSDLTPEEFKVWMRGVWQIPIEAKDRGGHPCPFPEELVKRVIKLHSYVGDWVIDVFNGSGTTTAVAKRLNRRYTGIDREQAFCDYATKRTDAEIPIKTTMDVVTTTKPIPPTNLTEETKRNVWNEDCITGAPKRVADETIDLGIYDPPFGIGEASFDKYYRREAKFTIPGYVEAPKEYRPWTLKWMAEAKRILKPNGCMYVVSGYSHAHTIQSVAEELGLHLICLVYYGQTFWRPTKRKFSSSCYPIFLFAKSAKARYTFNENCRFTHDHKDLNGRSLLYYDLRNIWQIPTEYRLGKFKNTNKLPTELIRKMIQYSSNKGDLVCDFFLGNFTTAYMAQDLNRRVTGFEINPNAFDYHVNGIDPSTGQARSEQHE